MVQPPVDTRENTGLLRIFYAAQIALSLDEEVSEKQDGCEMVKRIGSLSLSLFLAAGFLFWVRTGQAHAYIDIGSASYILQIAVASLFGGLFTLKIFWGKVMFKISQVVSKVRGSKSSH